MRRCGAACCPQGGAPGDGAAPHTVGGASVVPRCRGRRPGGHRLGRQPRQHMAGSPGLHADDVLDAYRHEASLVDAVIAASSAGADLAWWPFPGSEWRLQIFGMSCST